MSTKLQALLERVARMDADAARELEIEVDALSKRREFGLNFEKHMPERVALVGRPIGVGDKVAFIAPRGEDDVPSRDAWIVESIDGETSRQTAHLRQPDSGAKTTREVDNLVLVADFRDPIYPGLRSTGRVERGGSKPFHVVVNAENYHALEAMLFTNQGQVDVIYIDPPYNTRDKDWKYNNNYVDPNDDYAHSKWLSFMERRLKLAKKLLNPKGSTLIVTIDEKEVHRLGLLLDQIFPGVRCQMVTSVISSKGSARRGEFSRVEEYVFCVYIGGAGPRPTHDNMLAGQEEGGSTSSAGTIWLSMLRRGSDARRIDREKQFYPIFVDEKTATIHSVGESLLPVTADRSTVIPPKGTVAVWPLRRNGSEGRWQIGRESFIAALAVGTARLGRRSKTGQWAINYLNEGAKKRIESGEIIVSGTDEKGALVLKYADDVIREKAARTVWHRSSHDASTYGTSMLAQFLPNRKFPYPKSLYAVEDVLRFFVGDRPDALIVDFFGGSGTTAHAVARLNHQDGGRRRTIIVTNNEVSDDEAEDLRARRLRQGDPEWEALGICEYITKPRLRAAITGLTPEGTPVEGDYRFLDEFPFSDGFEENAEFFDLTYEDPALVELDLAFTSIAPLLWMRAGATGARIDQPADTYSLADTYAVLFSVDASAPFLKEVHDASELRVVYIVTDDERQFQMIATALPEGLEAIRLYESYLRTFEINTGKE